MRVSDGTKIIQFFGVTAKDDQIILKNKKIRALHMIWKALT